MKTHAVAAAQNPAVRAWVASLFSFFSPPSTVFQFAYEVVSLLKAADLMQSHKRGGRGPPIHQDGTWGKYAQ